MARTQAKMRMCELLDLKDREVVKNEESKEDRLFHKDFHEKIKLLGRSTKQDKKKSRA